MRNISFSSILLFALVIPFIMTYRISPGQTPYWLFGLIFLSLLSYLVLDLLNLSEKIYFKCKQIALWFVVITVIGSAFISAIIVRHQTAPVYNVHDIVLQQEAAMRFLIQGKNPYEATYFGTPLEEWHYSDRETNPALYHFVMQPFYLLFALPFYFLSNHTIGYFDGRMPLLFLFFVTLATSFVVVKDKEKRQLFLILLAFNPAMLGFTLEGRSDVFMFGFLILGFYFLHIKKYFLAGLPMALAFAVKQSVWPLLPLYFFFLFLKKRNTIKVLKSFSFFFIIFGIIVLPFLFWNQKAFLDSTVFYLSGSAPHSYPISGYGFGMLLNELGIIKNLNQYYPFWIWQILAGIPALIILTKYIKKDPSVNRLIIAYGIFLFIFWYFSRYLNNSHLGYLSMVFITAYFWPSKD